MSRDAKLDLSRPRRTNPCDRSERPQRFGASRPSASAPPRAPLAVTLDMLGSQLTEVEPQPKAFGEAMARTLASSAPVWDEVVAWSQWTLGGNLRQALNRSRPHRLAA